MLLRPLLSRWRRLSSCAPGGLLSLPTRGRGAFVAGHLPRRRARARSPLALACRRSAGRADSFIIKLRRTGSIVSIMPTAVPARRRRTGLCNLSRRSSCGFERVLGLPTSVLRSSCRARVQCIRTGCCRRPGSWGAAVDSNGLLMHVSGVGERRELCQRPALAACGRLPQRCCCPAGLPACVSVRLLRRRLLRARQASDETVCQRSVLGLQLCRRCTQLFVSPTSCSKI